MDERGNLGVLRGSALYVGALIGPGVLLVPALAAQAAGAASIIAWAGLLVVSAPLAITFAALGVRHPVSGGVSAYVREGFGDAAAAVTGGALPRWLAGDAYRSVPRRPLALIALVSVTLIAGLVAGFSSTENLVRATSACFIAVYLLAIGSAIRILHGRIRVAAFLAFILTLALGVFSAQYLAVVVAGALLLRRRVASRIADDDAFAVDAHD